MKPLIISLEYRPQIGGIASYVYNLALHWPNHEAVVLAPKWNKPKEAVDFDAQQPFKTYRRNLYWPIWPRWIGMVWQAWRIAKKEKCDCIFVQHCLPAGYAAWLLKKFTKIPYFVFFHGTDLEMTTAKRNKRFKTRIILAAAAKVVLNSQFMKNKLQARLPEIEENKLAILYPAPADFFFDLKSTTEIENLKNKLALDGKKVMLTVARLAEGKGYPHLVRILPKILKRVPNLVWVIIGSGPKEKAVMEMIQKDYLQNVVRFLGSMPYESLPDYYQLADLFVLLTHKDENREEGWGTVFLEAAVSGVPVVAGEVGGVSEVVANLHTGVLVSPYEDEQVVNTISEFLLNLDYAKQMGGDGRDRVLAEFTWDKQIKNVFN